MRSKADETLVIVETLICPLQISHLSSSSFCQVYVSSKLKSSFVGIMFKDLCFLNSIKRQSSASSKPWLIKWHAL